jgi:CRISPR-associated endonuclease Cas3-HD
MSLGWEHMVEEIKRFEFGRLLSYVELMEGGKVFEETFSEHAHMSLKVWDSLKRRVLPNLARVLDRPNRDVEEAVSLTILLHDAGKLTTQYQCYLERKRRGEKIPVGFNHEVASIPVLLNYMNRIGVEHKLSQIAAGAVLFHHEALRQYQLRCTVNYLVSPIFNKYRNGVVRFAPSAAQLLTQLLTELMEFEPYKNQTFDIEFSIKDLRDELTELFQTYDSDSPIDLSRIRLRVSAIQHILCVCDNRASWKIRPKKSPTVYIKEIVEGGWQYENCHS